MDRIRVLLVEDHDLVAQGLLALLGDEDWIEPLGVAGTVALARDRVASLHPHVVLMDHRLPDGTGVDACREIVERYPGTAVVMLTASVEPDVLQDALAAGCTGFLDKGADVGELLGAIRSASEGEASFSREVLRLLVQVRRQPPRSRLTEREREILQLVADGRSAKEVAGELHLSIHTVRNHLRNAMEKLGARTRLEAVVTAARQGDVQIADAP